MWFVRYCVHELLVYDHKYTYKNASKSIKIVQFNFFYQANFWQKKLIYFSKAMLKMTCRKSCRNIHFSLYRGIHFHYILVTKHSPFPSFTQKITWNDFKTPNSTINFCMFSINPKYAIMFLVLTDKGILHNFVLVVHNNRFSVN